MPKFKVGDRVCTDGNPTVYEVMAVDVMGNVVIGHDQIFYAVVSEEDCSTPALRQFTIGGIVWEETVTRRSNSGIWAMAGPVFTLCGVDSDVCAELPHVRPVAIADHEASQ